MTQFHSRSHNSLYAGQNGLAWEICRMTPEKKPYYIKFETPKEVSEAAYEVLRQASRTGKVRKGTNESTKAIERGQAKLVVIAEDVTPPEVVAHLPILCDERKIPYVFVPSKDQIGPAIGIDVSTASAAVLDAGEGNQILEQVTQELSRLKKTQ
jgi:large subunit ribosomal protein L7Ae